MATNPNVTNMLTGKLPVQTIQPKLPVKPPVLQRVFYRNQGESTVYDNFGKKYSTPQEFFDAGGKWENVQIRPTNPKYTPTQITQLKQQASTPYKEPTFLGKVNNFVNELPSAVSQVAGSFARGGMAAGRGLYDLEKGVLQGKSKQDIWKDVTRSDEQVFEPQSRLGKAVAETLFNKPQVGIPTLARYGEENAAIIPGGEGFAKKNPTLAFGLGLGSVALDFTGEGGAKNVAKTLSTLNKVEDTSKVLRNIGVAEDLVAEYAPIFAKTKNEVEASKVLNTLNEGQKAIKSVPKTVDPLMAEARKYKSVEEFVSKQPTFYRGEGGSNVAQGKALLAEGKHLASDAEYPKGFGKVGEYVIKPGAKVLDLGDSTFAEISQKLGIPERSYIPPKELSAIAKEKGYGVLKYNGEYRSTGKQFTHIVDLTGDSTITKSQLTDIWNKANGVAPSSTTKPSLQTPKLATPTEKPTLGLSVKSEAPETPVKPRLLSEPVKNPSYTESITQTPANKVEAKRAFSQFEIADPISGKSLTGEAKPKLFPGITDDIEKLRDISGFQGQFKDVYRNFKRVFGDKFDAVKKAILDPFDAAKGKYIDDQKALLNELDTKIVKELGIKKGSKESAAVMDYGEGLISKADLTKQFGADKANKIIEADNWFRAKYDQLLDEVNAVRKQIYPNNETKLIPKRKDYYRHYQELSGWGGLKNIFDTPSAIDPKLSGISPFTKPKSKFLSFAQKRLGLQSERDAVGGFLNYIPSSAYAKNIDPHIGQFRKLASELADSTTDTRNVNNFIEFLQDYANDLAGKTNPADRYLQKVIPGGRTTMNAINWINQRVKANTILGNVSSSLAQIFGVPLGVGSAKQYSVPGFARTVGQIFDKDPIMNKSSFIKERFSGSMYNKFDTKMLDKGRNVAGWIMGVLDEVGTKFIWNSHYQKALSEGIKDPIKYADDTTRALVAGRGIGEVPLGQKAKITQLLAPFQLEVANLWYVLGDQVKAKDFSGIATFLIANYLLNRGVEKVRGNDVSFDPVNSVIDGIKIIEESGNKKQGITKALGRQAGEVLSNIPFGQTAAGVYPESGMNIPGVGKIPREDLFGEGDPTRFGSGLLAVKGLKDPLFKILPSFGGAQLKKTIEGTKALIQGQIDSKSDKKLFDVGGNIFNKIKLPLFGKFASQEGQDYTDQQNSQSKLLKNKLNSEERVIFDKLKNSSPEDAKRILLESAQINEESTKKILEAFTEDKLGTTEEDKQMQSLGVKDGKRAQAVWEKISNLPKEEQRKKLAEYADKKILTEDVLKQVIEFKAGDRKPTFENEEEIPKQGLLKTITTYAKAIGTDPITAFNRIFTGQRIRRLDNGAIIVERMPLTESQKVKSDRGAGDTMILDHTIPLQLGGSNSGGNLNLVEESVWETYTPVENKLGKLLRDKKITKEEAQKLIKDFKEGKVSAEEIMNRP